MSNISINIEAARTSITDSLKLISEGKNEQVIRDSFTSYLRQIFPDQPGWVVRHIQGTEAAVKINKGKKESTGFVDNLVDLAAIEYESDLTKTAKFNEGFNQVKDYCSSLANKGHDPELIIGILSDTVRWYAYEINLSELPDEQLNRNNIVLTQIDSIDCSANTVTNASDLVNFLCKYLGRIGARPVSAYSISKDLGFESTFCQKHIISLQSIVEDAFKGNTAYSTLIEQLWCNFVSYLREDGVSDQFDLKTYVDEYYILTLGKLLCANFLERSALSSDEQELKDIISGTFFENKGLINFVEYDYFGWLNSEPHLLNMLPVAQEIQQDLVAYNFKADPTEDLFGELMAQLANRSQRVLLGQEWTPSWLSKRLVEEVTSNISSAEDIRLIDMCCGSGSMIVEAIKIAKARITSQHPAHTQESKIDLMVKSITGFDIDPLAVMLSKINWILAGMDWLQPLGAYLISIPVYHADSLFAITPISNQADDEDNTSFTLKIAEHVVSLPNFLISPEYKGLFDSLVDTGYHMVVGNTADQPISITHSDLQPYLEGIKVNLGMELEKEQEAEILDFLCDFISKVDALNKDGRNGIWAYIMRNSFRPGLVAGQFNGLVSNPPWLALSKIANNPYQQTLKSKAEKFDIKPEGSSHLHIELATIFLLHSIKEYLVDNSPIGCIVPDTILNGHHHNRFRLGNYLSASNPVNFSISKIWKVEKHVFKNNAIVLFGGKSSPGEANSNPIPGVQISETAEPEEVIFYRNRQGNRTAWSEQQLSENDAGFYSPANFRQGADIMPRNLLFYEVSSSANSRFVNAKSIDPVTSDLAFTVKDAKKFQDFSLSQRLLPVDLFFDIVTSNLLTPFHLAATQKAFLPIKKNNHNIWEVLPSNEINAKGAVTRNTFREIYNTLAPTSGTVDTIFDLINTRGKLVQQIVEQNGYLVFTGAGGGKVCSAYISMADFDANTLILDQTVYWAQVNSESEAIYLVGLLNSQSINQIIEDFQPRGAFGKRHVHKLPFGVTPPYDETQIAHQEVVEKTRLLIQEYNLLTQGNAEVQTLLNPNSSTLSRRRKKLYDHIVNLNAYNEYEAACKSLYGV